MYGSRVITDLSGVAMIIWKPKLAKMFMASAVYSLSALSKASSMITGALHGAFAFGVQRRRRLVEHDDGRVFEQGTRDADALALAARQAPARFADARVPALRQAFDEVQALGGAGGLPDFFVGGFGAGHADVGQHGVVKQVNVLKDDGDQAVERFGRDVAHVHAANAHAARLRVGVAHEQAGDGGFAPARGADEGGHAVRRQRGAKAGKHLGAAAGVGKVNAFKGDVKAQRRLPGRKLGQRRHGQQGFDALQRGFHQVQRGREADEAGKRLGKARQHHGHGGQHGHVQATLHGPAHASGHHQQQAHFHHAGNQHIGLAALALAFGLQLLQPREALLQMRRAHTGAAHEPLPGLAQGRDGFGGRIHGFSDVHGVFPISNIFWLRALFNRIAIHRTLLKNRAGANHAGE